MKYIIPFAIASVAMASDYEALKAIAPLDTIVVEAPLIATQELRATSAVEVYTHKEITASKAKDISSFLNAYTSVSVQSGFGNTFAPKIELRGYGLDNGNQNVVVVVNGRRLNNIDSAPQFLAAIPLESIEKIEILKGSGSVEYGDNATSGVISITTQTHEGVTLETRFGDYGMAYGALGAGAHYGDLSVSFFADRDLRGGSRTINADGDKDEQELTNASVEIAYYPSDTLEWHFNARNSRGSLWYAPAQTLEEFESDPTTLGSAGLGYHNFQRIDDRVVGAGVSWEVGKTLFKADVSRETKSIDFASYDVNSTQTYDSTTDYEVDQAVLSVEYDVDAWRLLAGVQVVNGDRHVVNNFGSDNVAEKKTEAFFAKARYDVGHHGLSAGARIEEATYTYNDAVADLEDKQFGRAFDVGYNYRISSDASLFANINRAYVLPDTDKFFTYDFALSQYSFNGFIEPMVTTTYNLGYNRNSSNNRLKTTLFYVDGDNEIFFNPTTFQNTNFDATRKLGVELFNKYRLSDTLYLQGNYTYVRSTIETAPYKGNDLPAAPRHTLVATAGYTPIDAMIVRLTHTYRSRAYAFEDLENDNAQRQKVYNSTDLLVSYLYGNGEFYATVTNLFDHANMILNNDDQVHPVDAVRMVSVGAKIRF